MGNDHNIKKFSAIDIEKYHKGQLTSSEMHELEKAALDDPFLADALEGYAIPGTQVKADLDELKQRLAERTERAKVVPITKGGRSFPILRIAAMVILIAGAAFLVYQFAFTDDKPEIALAPAEKKKTEDKSEETTAIKIQADSVSPSNATSEMAKLEPVAGVLAQATSENKNAQAPPMTDSLVTNQDRAIARETVEMPAKASDDKDIRNLSKQQNAASAPIQAEKEYKKSAFETDNELAGVVKTDDNNRAFLKGAQAGRPLNTNLFRGQIVDSNNTPLPYANITNISDNIGTYSDVKGNFVLTSPDSVLNVQVRSLGYADNYVRLQNQMPGNQVVMQEDRSVSPVVLSNKKTNSTRSRSSIVLEEPEPVDGWSNYDTYLANNLRVPDMVKKKQTTGGEVKLSFEVNKNGEPVNITIDRSLCETCDKEAIRLLKEGPRWKRKSRKGRTSVTVAF